MSATDAPGRRLFAVGGAHVDRRGAMSGPHRPGVSNPGSMREEAGGACLNALRWAVARGACGAILSVRGGDTGGELVATAIAAAGITDLSAIFLDRATPSYTAILDSDGELITALADMSLYEMMFPKQLTRRQARDAVAEADAILADANLPETALRTLVRIAAGKPIHAIAISPAKAPRLLAVATSIACLFANRKEASALCDGFADGGDVAARLRVAGFARGVITDGANPVICFEPGAHFTLTPPRPRAVADVTGAGDALAGATIAAMLGGRPFIAAVREGLAAAMLTIESPRAVLEFDERAFTDALGRVSHPETPGMAAGLGVR